MADLGVECSYRKLPIRLRICSPNSMHVRDVGLAHAEVWGDEAE